MIGLITGSGFYDLPNVVDRSTRSVSTPYGSVDLTLGLWGSEPVAFLPRHGSDHSVAPAVINYRANAWALKDAGAQAILATAVSGGISPDMSLGRLVIIKDFLDFTWGRADTFFDGRPAPDGTASHLKHCDMSHPYDPELRRLLLQAASELAIDVFDGGVYCTTNGPRFETPAEIEMMGRLGGDLVGMTGYPEVVLANELDVPYASIGVISNPAAGLTDEKLSEDDIMKAVELCAEPLHLLIGKTIEQWASERTA